MITPSFPSKSGALFRFLLVPLAVAALGFCTPSASALVTYSIDDGTAEDGVGEGGPYGGDVLFLNEFPVAPNGNVIASISVAFGSPNTAADNAALIGLPYTVLLYSDLNGDGNPSDATLLTFAGGVITAANTNTFLTTAITPTTVTTSDFFVGFELLNQPPGTFPAAIDETAPTDLGRSYVTYGFPGTLNPIDLEANEVPPETIESVPGSTPGNWLIRANYSVPEPSTWAYVLASMAGGCLLFRRRAQA